MTRPGLRRPGTDLLPAAILAVAIAGACLWVLLLGRGSSFWSDDWAFIVFRQGHDPDVFLRAFNGHFAAVPIALYKLLLQAFGLGHHWPYRAAVLGLHAAGVVLVWLYLRERVGPWAALAPALVLLAFGPAAELLVYPVNVGFQLAIVCGVGALLLLDGGPGRRRAAAACALLTVGIASSSVAVPFLLVAASSVLAPEARRTRWWVVAVPATVYAAWTLAYGTSELVWSNADIVWAYGMDGLARTTGALAALGPEWGRTLVVAAAALVLWAIARAPRAPTRLIGLALGLLAFWALTGLARAQLGVPGSERFLYPSAVLLVLVLGEALSGRRVPRRLAPALAVVVAAVVYANGTALHDQTLAIRDIGANVAGGVAAVVAEPGSTPDAFRPPLPLYGANAGQLRTAVRLYGAPPSNSAPGRQSFDDVLRAAAAPLLRAAPPGGRLAPPAATAGPGTTLTPRRGCLVAAPGAAGALVLAELPRGGLLVRAGAAPVEVRTRRLATGFGAVDVRVAAGAARLLGPLPASGPPPWNTRLTSTAGFTVCAAAG